MFYTILINEKGRQIMAIKTLHVEIAKNISYLKKLKKDNPSWILNARLQAMYEVLHSIQEKEWEDNIEEYQKAKSALDLANQTAQEALDNLLVPSKALEKSAKAALAIRSALSV